jgi:hypothetical protein
MYTNSQMQQQFSADVPTKSSDVASLINPQANADVIRAENNVLQWMSYLPEDCVKTMIEMGWDDTT